jgi:serine/threonine protein kinase
VEATSPRWKEITTSQYPWERQALAFVRERLPDHEPYRAWSNFEFIAEDGSINEVDLLLLTPKGFFLIEIKSKPGIVEGDAGTWSWHYKGTIFTDDNPLILANRKVKKLISLLRRQKSMRKVRSPYLEAHVFLAHETNRVQLPAHLADNVHVSDRPAAPGKQEIAGIIAALTRWTGAEPPRRRMDRPIAKAVTRAMEEAGIRPSVRARRVLDYELGDLLFEGPNYQDWSAAHVSLKGDRARIRIYPVHAGAGAELRDSIVNAARREYSILGGIQHPGILKPKNYTDTERGPALIFEHIEQSQRLDHYLSERISSLTVDQRLHLLRQIAETVRYAHQKGLIHRALSPQSILVLDPTATEPTLQILNWQTASREPVSSRSTSLGVTATSHVDRLIEESSAVYMAPEALAEPGASGEETDVFSLGAIAYHLFSGQAPATSFHELTEKLREDHGLRISSVLDGASESLQYVIKYSTHPEVTSRLETVDQFLEDLEQVEAELTEPDRDGIVADPGEARQGDRLEHDVTVKRRIGRGGSAIAFLVERDGKEQVLKLARDASQNQHLKAEAEALRKLRHQYIVELFDELQFGDRIGLLLSRAGTETLADRIRQEGRIALEHLERFGEDLLQTVDWLEQQGLTHRDIKPQNLGVSSVGRGSQLHLVLFDFSLTGMPPENISSGTRPYLDPFLPERKPRRWDSHAERYAAAVTLYQMSTGVLPVWGDNRSDPAVLQVEATLEPDAFEPALREKMTAFFTKALKRSFAERFDNAQEMLHGWRAIFVGAAKSTVTPHRARGTAETVPFAGATLDMSLAGLGLSTRAMNALERLAATTVEHLLRIPLARLNHIRGVGSKTRKELREAVRILSDQCGDLPKDGGPAAGEKKATETTHAAELTIDKIAAQLLPGKVRKSERPSYEALRLFLRLKPTDAQTSLWPSQSAAADEMGVTRVRIGQILAKARRRWLKISAITQLREEVVTLLDAEGGVMTGSELARAILARHGSEQVEPLRTCQSLAVARATLEAERERANPRWIVRRPHSGERILIARDELDDDGTPRIDGQRLADYAERLGRVADELAQADPLHAPDRILETLQEITPPPGEVVPSSNRLYHLAAATSRTAALSSRFELYPKEMSAQRALRLSLGALAGAKTLTVDEIHERVMGRYPEAESLPGRPQLDRLLDAVGSELRWRPDIGDGGSFVSPLREFTTVASGSTVPSPSHPRLAPDFVEVSEEQAERKQFQQRLEYSIEQQHFLALVTPPRWADSAERALARRFPVDVRSFDELLIRHMKRFAEEKKVNWDLVLSADAVPTDERAGSRDWANLQRVVREALPRVQMELEQSSHHHLLTNLGLLSRYDRLAFLDTLRDTAGRGAPGIWLLVATDAQEQQPTIDGKPMPVFSTAQWARIPEAWLWHKSDGSRSSEDSHP